MIAQNQPGRCGGERWAKCTGVVRSRRERGGVGTASADPCEDGSVSTRTLLVLAAVMGLAILVAGAVQILLAR